MNTQFTTQPKPTLVNVIAWMTLASGIVNLFWGLVASLLIVLGTIGFGLVCTPFTILPTVLGIFEIIYAAKLLSNPPQAVQPSTAIAILEIVCILAGNLFSVVVGILALVFYNDVTVRDYFAQLNGRPAPVAPVAPVVPVEPVPVTEPEPPVVPEMNLNAELDKIAPAAAEENAPVAEEQPTQSDSSEEAPTG